jgi:hypothetical protein
MIGYSAHDLGQSVSQYDLGIFGRMHEGMTLRIEITRIYFFVIEVCRLLGIRMSIRYRCRSSDEERSRASGRRIAMSCSETHLLLDFDIPI